MFLPFKNYFCLMDWAKMWHEITEFCLLKLLIIFMESDVQMLDSTELHPSCADA
jgi:hypothetical protein